MIKLLIETFIQFFPSFFLNLPLASGIVKQSVCLFLAVTELGIDDSAKPVLLNLGEDFLLIKMCPLLFQFFLCPDILMSEPFRIREAFPFQSDSSYLTKQE